MLTVDDLEVHCLVAILIPVSLMNFDVLIFVRVSSSTSFLICIGGW